ncbi:MAG: APC family permease [Actinobacteria bacterium]|nr:APC family permease [Actinomycetota bacterium]
MNLVVNGALTFGIITVTYPRASLWLAFLIGGFFCTLEAVVYALITAAMPRSGGDYVFQSRVFGGAVGTLFAFTFACVAQVVAMGINGFVFATVIMSPFLALLGGIYHANWMIEVGTWFAGKWGIFFSCLFCTAFAAAINIKGLKWYALIQRICFWVGGACLLVLLVTTLFTSHDTFVSHYNSFMSSFGTENAYQVTLSSGGSTDTSFSLWQTLLAAIIASYVLIYPAWSAMQAGEVRQAKSVRRNLNAMVGAEVFTFGLLALIAVLITHTVGQHFLYASGNLFLSGAENNPLPVPPFLGFLFAVAGKAAIFVWIGFVMFFAWGLTIFSNGALGATRAALVMAQDRILPSAFAKVNPRTHTPVFAIGVYTLLTIPASIAFAFWSNFASYTISYFIMNITAIGVTILAGAVFPFRRPLLFKGGAADHRIGRVPVITIAGAIFVAFVIFVDVMALTHDELGVNGSNGLIFLGVLFGFSALVYITARLYRRFHDHIDISAAYSELPVE